MSPLRWFRRHATWMLIIFGVVLMAIFGLGPVFDNMAQGFRNSGVAIEDETLIEYRGGVVKQSKVEQIQRDHYATQRFLQALTEQAAKQCEENDVQYARLARLVPPIQAEDDSRRADQALSRKLMAERAEDEGIVISDDMIESYLGLLAGDANFTQRDLQLINKTVNPRTGMIRIKNQLRLELLAMQLQRFTLVGVPSTPIPTEAVELYARANNRIECEVVPVSVNDYIPKVTGEPSAAEKKALFAEGKYQYAEADKKEPGFKKPREVNVQYFVADLKTFLTNEKARITDAEVEAEYNKLVKAEDPLVVEIIGQDGPQGFMLDGLGDEDQSTEEPSDTESTEEPNLESDGEEQEATKKSDSNAATEESTSSTEEAESSDQSSADEDKTDAGDQQSSHVVSETKKQRVSLNQEDEKANESDEGNAQAETAADVVNESQDNAANAESDQEQEEVGGLANLQLSDEAADPMDDDDKKIEFKPLSEVADSIRERLAQQTAMEKKDEAQKRVMVTMQNYQNTLLLWETRQETEQSNDPPPKKPDFAAIADEYGLSFRETGLVSELDLMQTEIGKVQVFRQIQTPQGIQPSLANVSQLIFSQYNRTEAYDPQEVTDFLTRNGFIFWLSEKVDVRIPTIDEASSQIVEYWKYRQAIDLAMKDAQKMADKATSSGKKLTELFPETAGPTGEFTWFNPGGGGMAAYSSPIGTDNAGEQFMQTAFGLAEGETGVAANDSKDTIYVIQRTTPQSSLVETGQEYLSKQYFRFKRLPPDVIGVAQVYAREIQFEMQDEFKDAMGVKQLK